MPISSPLSFPSLLLITLSILFKPLQAYFQDYAMKNVYMLSAAENYDCFGPGMTRVERNMSGYVYSHFPFDGKPYRGRDKEDTNCILVIHAPLGFQVELWAEHFYLAGNRTVDGLCDGDTLQLLDHKEPIMDPREKLGQMATQLCSGMPAQPLFVSSSNALTLWLHIQMNRHTPAHPHATGFKLRWTVSRLSTKEKPCLVSSEFACGNQRCIPRLLVCDPVAHCGDQADLQRSRQIQAGCTNVPSDELLGQLSVAAVTGIAIGAALALLTLGVAIFTCCGRQRSQTKLAQNAAGVRNRKPIASPPQAPLQPHPHHTLVV